MGELLQPHEWIKDKILATEKDLNSYVGGLGLYIEDLDGDILDLGSGAKQLLNKSLAQLVEANPDWGVHPHIVSLSPDTENAEVRANLQISDGYEGKTVAGIGQKLPFKDESFDRVFSLGGVVTYAGFDHTNRADEKTVQAWMSEATRVLKRGGEARFGMIYGEESNLEYIEAFEKLNLDAEIQIEQAFDDAGLPYLTTTEPAQNLYRIIISKKAKPTAV